MPAETKILASIDFGRLRATPVWAALASLRAEEERDRKLIEELVARTGLDPFRQIHRVVLAFPEDARTRGEMAVVIEGDVFDQRRLLTYIGDQARLKGRSLTQSARRRRTLWSYGGELPATGFFVDDRRIVIGTGGWAEKVADTADGVPGARSVTDAGELQRLIDRAGAARGLVAAALVPESTRRRLLGDLASETQASVLRLAASADFGPGLDAELVAEMSNAADARALVETFRTFVQEGKRSPQVLLLGAGPYLDALTARADGPTARFRLALGEAQTRELLDRLKGLLKLRRQEGP
jgi:hypothetical protein